MIGYKIAVDTKYQSQNYYYFSFFIPTSSVLGLSLSTFLECTRNSYYMPHSNSIVVVVFEKEVISIGIEDKHAYCIHQPSFFRLPVYRYILLRIYIYMDIRVEYSNMMFVNMLVDRWICHSIRLLSKFVCKVSILSFISAVLHNFSTSARQNAFLHKLVGISILHPRTYILYSNILGCSTLSFL